jgi:hypothetical protein
MLIGIFGGFGSGKTLLLTVITVNASKTGRYECYANFKIDRKNVSYIEAEDLLDINPEGNMRAFIGLDEIYAWLDSRVSSSKVNRVLSWIILQSRKRNMDICYTAQLSSSIDIRLRNMTDIAIFANKKYDGFYYDLRWQNENQVFNRKFFLSANVAQFYYNKYNTREIVKPVDFDELRKAFK